MGNINPEKYMSIVHKRFQLVFTDGYSDKNIILFQMDKAQCYIGKKEKEREKFKNGKLKNILSNCNN